MKQKFLKIQHSDKKFINHFFEKQKNGVFVVSTINELFSAKIIQHVIRFCNKKNMSGLTINRSTIINAEKDKTTRELFLSKLSLIDYLIIDINISPKEQAPELVEEIIRTLISQNITIPIVITAIPQRIHNDPPFYNMLFHKFTTYEIKIESNMNNDKGAKWSKFRMKNAYTQRKYVDYIEKSN